MFKLNNIKLSSKKIVAQPATITNDFFNRLRKKEYSRLDKLNHTYLDFTGANLYPESLVKIHYHFLQNAVYGNPHSANPASHLSEKFITEARNKVLDFFDA